MTARCFWPPDRSEGYFERNRSTGDEPDPLEGGDDLARSSVAGGDPVDHQRVADRLLDGHRRVERGVRVLEDHLEVGAQLAQLARRASRRRVVSPGPPSGR